MHVVDEKQKTPAACLFSREQGLGVTTHMQIQFTSINIGYYTLLVLKRLLFINYIAYAIDSFLGLCA